MVNPALYAKNTSNQETEAHHVLKSTVQKMSFNEKEQILDVGCGSGSVTANVLKLYLPKDCTIVGADISEDMVKFARNQFEQVNLTFRNMDIGSPNIWDNWNKNSFDKIFSFFCLHWVENMNQAVENLSSLLKRNGDLVTLIIAESPYAIVFKILQEDPLYPYVQEGSKRLAFIKEFNYDRYILELKSHSFDIKSTELLEKKRRYNNIKEWMNFFDSVNPFLELVKEEDKKKLSQAAAQYLLDQGTVQLMEDGSIEYNYKIFNTHARKL